MPFTKQRTSLINVKNTEKVIKEMRSRFKYTTDIAMRQGMAQAALYLQARSQEMVPVEMGNLKASAFVRDQSVGANVIFNIGYVADYAAYVHEQVAMKWKGKKRVGTNADGLKRRGRYWDPQGKAQAKFLERPFITEFPTMMKIIENALKKSL